jgi:hypothetical protein
MRLQTRAFAIASGYVATATVFVLTLLLLFGGYSAEDVPVLTAVLFGYSVSVPGAFIGGMWAYAYGFLWGAAAAFAYNLAVIPPAPPPFDWDADIGSEER